ncbi:MAG: PKD domain-containing protein [Bacteroidetes bacterium]|nr:PKD domain-containing protein [Bacteroidota bacterium]
MNKVNIVIFSFFQFFSLICHGQSFDMPCIADSRVSSNQLCPDWATSNNGTIPVSDVAHWTWFSVGCGEGTLRGLWQFNVSPPISEKMLYDNRSTLHLFFPTGSMMGHQYNGAAQNNQFYIERVVDSWGELTVTWNNQPGVTATSAILVPSSLTNPSFDDYLIDISPIALDWICNAEPNYGIRLRMLNETELYRWVSFTNREFLTINKRPYLRLEYAEINASGPANICIGDDFNIECSLNNANDPSQYTYSWTHLESGVTYSTQNVNLPQHQIGLNTYVVVVSNPWCQTATDTVFLSVNEQPQPQVNASGSVNFCQGDSVTLTSNYTTGNLWSNGSTSQAINVLSSGDYSVSVTLPGGCSSNSSPVSVTVNQTPTSTFTIPQSACTSANIMVVYQGNATANATYTWDFGGGNIVSGSGQGAYTITYLNAGSYTVSLSVTENNCTSPSTTNTITVDLTPSVLINGDQTICEGESLQFTYNGNAPTTATYLWQPGNGTILSGSGQGPVSVQYDQPGITFIGLTVTQGSCVSDLYEMPVEVYPLPSPNIINDYSSSCDSFIVNFSTSANAITYNWDFGNGITATTQNATTSYYSGVYDVTLSLTDANGCSSSFTSPGLIQVYPSPVAAFTTTPELTDTIDIENGSITFNNMSVGGNTYNWDFGDGSTSSLFSPTHTYSSPGIYTIELIVSNILGCSDTAILGPFFLSPAATIFIPNTFTPNQDGMNDIFRVYGSRLNEGQLLVYNRIGEKVFETFDINQGWDGTFRGRVLNTGVYVYYCKVKFDSGRVEELFGDITLIR